MVTTPKITRLYLTENKLAMFLGGDGLARTFSCIAEKPGTLRDIHQYYITRYPPIAYTTLATHANKLVEKGFCVRRNTGGARIEYTYRTLYSPDALLAYGIDIVLRTLERAYPKEFARGLRTLREA